MYKVHCKSIMISQFSDLVSSDTYLFYILKVIGHFTAIIRLGGVIHKAYVSVQVRVSKSLKILRMYFVDGYLKRSQMTLDTDMQNKNYTPIK